MILLSQSPSHRSPSLQLAISFLLLQSSPFGLSQFSQSLRLITEGSSQYLSTSSLGYHIDSEGTGDKRKSDHLLLRWPGLLNSHDNSSQPLVVNLSFSNESFNAFFDPFLFLLSFGLDGFSSL